MSESEKSHLDHQQSRRAFVKTSAAAAAVGLLSACGAKVAAPKPAEAAAAPEPRVVALKLN
jgi:anaerobic selenocysteine-containing dehydrogenase